MSNVGQFVLIKGYDWEGRLVRFAEWLRGDSKQSSPRKYPTYSHAGVIVDDEGTIVQAEPGGARYGNIHDYDFEGYVISDWDLPEVKLNAIAGQARQLIGVPYSFLDYVSLVALRFHIRPKWLLNYVANSKHLICSQLVDVAFNNAGVQMFNDNRFPGDVDPENLALVLHGPVG